MFRITKDERTKTWVVVRDGFPREFHAHFKDKNGCHKLIALFEKGVKPHNPYFREAMQRITTEQEWNSFNDEFKKDKFFKKQKYMLQQKGC